VNGHGKLGKTKRGKFVVAAKGGAAAAKEQKEISRDVNLKNEIEAARRACQTGGRGLTVSSWCTGVPVHTRRILPGPTRRVIPEATQSSHVW